MNLLRKLQTDRGDASPVALVAGSILTLAAALVIGLMLTALLAGTTLAQSNADLTTKLEQEITAFESTPWRDLVEEAPSDSIIEVTGRDTTITREVYYDAAVNGYTIRLTAPRAVIATRPNVTCNIAWSPGQESPRGCMSLSATVVATSNDVAPELPEGISLTVQNINGTNVNTNLVAQSDFEAPEAVAAWAPPGAGSTDNAATIVDTTVPRARGVKELQATSDTVIYSQPIDAVPGDQFSAQAWAKVLTGSARVQVGIQVGGSAPVYGAQTTQAGWASLRTNTTVTGAGAVRLVVSVSECDGCEVRLDDVSVLNTKRNLVRDPAVWALTDATVGALSGSYDLNANNATVTYANIPVNNATKLTVSARVSSMTPVVPAGAFTVEFVSGATRIPLGQLDLAAIGPQVVPMSAIGDLNGQSTGSLVITLTQAAPLPDTALKVVTVSDVVLTISASANPTPESAPSVEVALIDTAAVKDTTLRVSFEYAGTPPSDLRVGVFCTTNLGIGSLSTNTFSLAQDTSGRDWYWARLNIPALDRLGDCQRANIRVWSASGELLESSLIGNVSIMKVMAGIKSQSGGGDE